MSNSFTSPPVLTDASRVIAAKTIRTTEFQRLADQQNYAFAVGGTSNVLSQCWDDSCYRQNSTSFVTMCEWYLPQLSASHQTLKIRLSAWCPTGGAQASFSFIVGGATYQQTITITDSSRYSSSFNTATINISSTHTDYSGLLKMEVKSPNGDDVEVLSVMAAWEPLASPLSAGSHWYQLARFTPQGQTRQGADLPLSARFGVEALENMKCLKTRPRVLFNWSGVESAASGSSLSVAAAAPRTIASGDLASMYSEAAIFAGMRDDPLLDIFAYVRVLQTSGVYSPITLDLMGQRITINATGWTSHTLSFRLDELPRSNEFGLSMYRVGLDDSAHNQNQLFLYGTDISASSPYVAGLSIFAV